MNQTDQSLLEFPMKRESPFDPPQAYSAVRTDGGLARVRLWDGSIAWLVTGYDQMRELMSDSRLSADSRHPKFPFPSPGRAALGRSGRTFITMDPPEHGRLRRVFTRYFAVKRIETLRPIVQQIVDDLITDLLGEQPPIDLVQKLALEVPARTICVVLGMPLKDRFYFQHLDHVRNTLTTEPHEVILATNKMLEYADQLIADKEREPADDLVSALVKDQLATGAIDRDELVAAIRLLITAGHETTANMIALSIVTLLRHPEQLSEIQSNPDLEALAVEELLRYLSIFHISPTRIAIEPIEISGKRIEAGDGVIPVVAGANRDGRAFPDPDGFDIHREARHHVAFGYGVHQCLGQPLARVELQTVIGTLFRRIPSLRLAIDIADLAVEDYAFLRLATLPVTWDRG